jgi:hypothetical protein
MTLKKRQPGACISHLKCHKNVLCIPTSQHALTYYHFDYPAIYLLEQLQPISYPNSYPSFEGKSKKRIISN